METEDIEKSTETFFQHVFNFNDESKKEMLNIAQYTVVALIPIVILNKVMQKFVPEADDEKGSVELLAEVLIQVIIMFLGILIVHRIITFVPTYSGLKYEKISITQIVLAVLMITLSLQTKLGEKISILYDRVFELIMGRKEGMDNEEEEEGKGKKKGKDYSKMTQKGQMNTPLQNASTPGLSITGGMQPPRSEPIPPTGSTALRDLPNSVQQQQQPDMGNEIMPANDALGGAFGTFAGF